MCVYMHVCVCVCVRMCACVCVCVCVCASVELVTVGHCCTVSVLCTHHPLTQVHLDVNRELLEY